MKLITFCLSIVLFNNITVAQKVQIGAEAGMNIIPMEDTDIGYNHQLGYHFGANFRYHFSEHFKLSSGVFLSQKKKKYAFSSSQPASDLINIPSFGGGGLPIDSLLNLPGVNAEATTTTAGTVPELFIEVPLLANFKYKHLNIYAGPYIGYLVSAVKKETVTTSIPVLDVIDIGSLDPTGLSSLFLPKSEETKTTESNNKDNLNQLDYGLNFGIGYEHNNLHFNLMYSYGLVDYREETNEQEKSTLKTLRISIAYLFNISKQKKGEAPKFN